MNQSRIIHWPDGPQQGDIHTEGGRTWEYVLMPEGSSVEGVWRDVGCKDLATNGPGWTLDNIKDWLGIEGNDFDDQIIAAMKITVSFVERYCNRLFEWRDNHKELKLPQRGNGWQLHLWPVSGEVFIDGVRNEYLVDNERGIIWFPNYKKTNFNSLQYSGGYRPDGWPADLLMVLMNIIKVQWGIQSGSGVPQDISRITIPDVGTLTYAASGSSGGGGSYGGGSFGPISWSDQMILDLYRLHEC